MAARDPRIDAYIARSADFARPILTQIRETVHAACPDVEETMKWSHPHFMYKGMLCGMAAFKEHCNFGFWKGSLIVAADGNRGTDALSQFSQIRKVADLPSRKVLAGYVKQAMKLNEEGAKAPARAKPKVKKELVVPEILTSALRKNTKARAAFEAFSPSHRKEYVEWITEAKTEATRDRRLATAIEWMAEGKPRNWKYMNC
jgi:uncharacterized protein YdeI (YjbR/CyaY-like superfamily)